VGRPGKRWLTGVRRESLCGLDRVQSICGLHCGIARIGLKQQKLRHQSDLPAGVAGINNNRIGSLPGNHKRNDSSCLRIAGLSCDSSHAALATLCLDASTAGLPGNQLGTVFPRGLCAGSGAVDADAAECDDVSERRVLSN